MESCTVAAETRIAQLRSLSAAEARADLERAMTGIRTRMQLVQAAKSAFDRAIAQRLDKESRHWASFAQTAYAGALDDAEAALEGRLSDGDRPLPAAPAFRARAGGGIVTLHPGREGIHRIDYRLAPTLDPIGTALIEHRPGVRCRLATDASPFPPALAHDIERAADALLADHWRTALCVLLDRCVETSMFATCIVGARAAAFPVGVADDEKPLPLLRRSF